MKKTLLYPALAAGLTGLVEPLRWDVIPEISDLHYPGTIHFKKPDVRDRKSVV